MVGAVEVAQSIERQLVMGAPGVSGIDDAEEQVHAGVPVRSRRRCNRAI
jgi:hypothetical protein